MSKREGLWWRNRNMYGGQIEEWGGGGEGKVCQHILCCEKPVIKPKRTSSSIALLSAE